ncbi:muscleblind-like protein 3 isoform X9 [Ischnura elegans]|uniref:muscleblind-like protein 3 isoform X9 n=1 Tax=Ischnura elegans TaxID=197161 RepID=UPI001ED88F6C|nr:muscleblind-like protein 3 isoform X9 [Ischnura elegans]
MAMVNMNNLLNGKDSRWLQLEVCREFQRNKCTRPDTECKFAHPPANVEVQNGRVTACYDSIKGRCNREKPPCKYFHPPQHLKDQLLINGRNHLALKNALMQQMGLAPGGQPLVPGQVPAAAAAVVGGKVQFATSPLTLGQPLMVSGLASSLPPSHALGQCLNMHAEGQSYNHNPIFITATNPYLTGMPQVGSTFSPYFTPAGPIMPVLPPDPASAAAAAAAAAAVASSSSLAVVPQTMVAAAQKMPRSDRLEVCREYQRGACKRAESECRFAHPPDTVVTASEDGGITVTVCMDAVKGRCNRDPCRYFHPPLHLQAHIKAAAQSRASTAHVPVSVATVGSVEVGKKRARDPSDDILLMDMKSVGSFYYDNFAFPGMVPYKRPAADKSGVPVYQPNATTYQQLMQLQQPFVPVSSLLPVAPSNAHYVVYTDEQGQLLDTLRVCQDFNRHNCKRPACKFVHLQESHVEVVDDRVTVCRDAAKGKCTRSLCKYYHIPIPLPPANEMAAAVAAASSAAGSSSGDRESGGGMGRGASPDASWAILHHALGNSTIGAPTVAPSTGIMTRGHI